MLKFTRSEINVCSWVKKIPSTGCNNIILPRMTHRLNAIIGFQIFNGLKMLISHRNIPKTHFPGIKAYLFGYSVTYDYIYYHLICNWDAKCK